MRGESGQALVGSLVAAGVGALLAIAAAFGVPTIINGTPTQATETLVTYDAG
jgi:hypothetical protein